jgi:AcrR family transcriptional regulator
MAQSDPERRQKILRAAEQLLKHYGFSKTTVGDIARAAGVGVGSVYLEFSSKDEIIAELSLRSHAVVLEAMRGALGEQGDYAGRLACLLQRRIQTFHDYARDGQHGLDLVLCNCPAVGPVRERFREQEEALLAELLQAADAAGEFSVDDPQTASRVILRIFDVFTPAHVERPEMYKLMTQVSTTCKLLMRGLLRRR